MAPKKTKQSDTTAQIGLDRLIESLWMSEDAEALLSCMLRTQAICLEAMHRTTKEFALEFLLQAQRAQRNWPRGGDQATSMFKGGMPAELTMLNLVRQGGELASKLSRRLERQLAAATLQWGNDKRSRFDVREAVGRSPSGVGRRYAQIKP